MKWSSFNVSCGHFHSGKLFQIINLKSYSTIQSARLSKYFPDFTNFELPFQSLLVLERNLKTSGESKLKCLYGIKVIDIFIVANY